MYIIMMGAQGTGKGTIAGMISKELNIPQISTGDIFRKNIAENTELGKLADGYISKGNLVPDEITINMVKERLKEKDAENGAILDGFPRNIVQAEELDKILENMNKKVDLVVNLTTPMEEILERILNRVICSNSDCKTIYNLKNKPPKVEGICDVCGSKLVQRKDDSDEEAIKKRLNIYFEQTEPLIEYYNKKGVVYTTECSEHNGRPSKIVTEDILKNKCNK